MKRDILRQSAWPLIVMLMMLVVVLTAYKGLPLESRPFMLNTLPVRNLSAQPQGDDVVAVYYDESNSVESVCAATVIDTLEEMRIPWQRVGPGDSMAENLRTFHTILLCTQDLAPLGGDVIALTEWLNDGGRLGLMMTPLDSSVFNILSRKLGIVERGVEYVPYKSILFVSAILPTWDAKETYSGDGLMEDFTMPVRLEEDCTVHIVSGGEREIPLLWSRDIGRGRLVVNNHTLITGKDSRGLALNALYALQDQLVYPIINAGVIFIDDFPAPQPEGTDQLLLEQFGYDTQGFFRNEWWPDMRKLAMRKGLRYTGVLVETYNRNVTGPFEFEKENDALLRYYASELLNAGGEMGLHGYNHMPLCLDGFRFAREDYITWPSTTAMAEGLRELFRYGSRFLTGADFGTYVPPSNYLSADGQRTLRETLPQVRTISGLYLPEIGVDALIQEFREEEDGSISLPRISVGFIPAEYDRFVLAEELMLHGVFSHFIHPDDVLDVKRGAGHGWSAMYSTFAALIDEIEEAFPPLRWSTASEGAAAVQRYARLNLARTYGEDALTVDLSPFYDEAWLALKAERPIQSVENGELYRIADGLYWIRADAARVRVHWAVNE